MFSKGFDTIRAVGGTFRAVNSFIKREYDIMMSENNNLIKLCRDESVIILCYLLTVDGEMMLSDPIYDTLAFDGGRNILS